MPHVELKRRFQIMLSLRCLSSTNNKLWELAEDRATKQILLRVASGAHWGIKLTSAAKAESLSSMMVFKMAILANILFIAMTNYTKSPAKLPNNSHCLKKSHCSEYITQVRCQSAESWVKISIIYQSISKFSWLWIIIILKVQ